MLAEFDELVKKRQVLKSWWKLGTTIAKYDRISHTLRVDVQKPSMVTYCGQNYAGGPNYHDAPNFFVEAIRNEIQEQIEEIVKVAYEKELNRLNSAIESQKAIVLEQLESAQHE